MDGNVIVYLPAIVRKITKVIVFGELKSIMQIVSFILKAIGQWESINRKFSDKFVVFFSLLGWI